MLGFRALGSFPAREGNYLNGRTKGKRWSGPVKGVRGRQGDSTLHGASSFAEPLGAAEHHREPVPVVGGRVLGGVRFLVSEVPL